MMLSNYTKFFKKQCPIYIMKETFNLKLSKRDVAILNHGRFKGMVDILDIIQKKIDKKLDSGEKVELSTVVTEIVGHKLNAEKHLNKSAKDLSEFAEDKADEKTEDKKKPSKKLI